MSSADSESPETLPVVVSTEHSVGILTLNRPGRLNAVNADLYESLTTAVVRLGRDAAVRAIVLTGDRKSVV